MSTTSGGTSSVRGAASQSSSSSRSLSRIATAPSIGSSQSNSVNPGSGKFVLVIFSLNTFKKNVLLIIRFY